MTDVNNETSANQDGSRAASTGSGASGLPLRGLAMVLIAVAVLFGLWALYSFTQGGDDERAATGTSQTVSESANGQAGTVTQDPTTAGAPATEGSEGAEGAEATDNPAAAADAEGTAAQEQPTSPAAAPNNGNVAAPSAGAGAGAAGGGISEADVKNVTVNVVNNSTITGLAEETYNDLRDRGYKVGEHGNLPEQELDNPLPETTVFYHPGDKVGQRAAEELAEQVADTYKVPTTTAPNIEQLPEGTARPGNVTLALIGELAPRQ
ncbi:LytR C-terminal domain-containing protein [Corynebacterium guangdongense]|uniref:LytR/CpsA/Psr regulator C-terminal domain-containing protein n=1 Tax=Corynebacterium guangdongense TaxID=1783348 RepID=A0ABU1ZZH1_9CORY|nr:LytR C-terminal domain-containing protein [Corynebacterium guangdongense]MDR7330334.1 hypothetical protein [Corynebacterium guangdongense]